MWYPVSDEVTTEAVTSAVVAGYLGVNEDELTSEIGFLVFAARAHVEAYCNRSFAAHLMTWECDRFADFSRVPAAPLLSITEISFVDLAGEAQVLDQGAFTIRADGLDPKIVLNHGAVWPQIQQGSRICITGTFGDATPDDVKHAILLLVGNADWDRENEARPAWTVVDGLLSNHRRGAW